MTTTGPSRRYRKTALIEATQWLKDGDHPAVLIDAGGAFVDTLEGRHTVTSGDWIATGVQGEHWPIKPDIFDATYEAVEKGYSTDPDRIWLEPNCCADPVTGRQWAQDNPWPNGDCELTCEATGVEYLRADLVAEIEAAAFARGEASALAEVHASSALAAAERRGYWRGRAEERASWKVSEFLSANAEINLADEDIDHGE